MKVWIVVTQYNDWDNVYVVHSVSADSADAAIDAVKAAQEFQPQAEPKFEAALLVEPSEKPVKLYYSE